MTLAKSFKERGGYLSLGGGASLCAKQAGGWNAENLQERGSLGASGTPAPRSKGPSTPSCPAPHSRLPGKSSILTRLAGTEASSPPPPRLSARPTPGPLRRELREVAGEQVRGAVAAGHLAMGGRKARASRGAQAQSRPRSRIGLDRQTDPASL